jgi:putative oxidoreductase
MASNSVPVYGGSQAATTLNHTGSRGRTAVHPAIVFAGRLLFATIFLAAGLFHFSHQEIQFAAQQGVPLAAFAVPLSGVIALLGGLSILLGYRAKLGAWLIVLFLVPVTVLLHNFWAVKDPFMAQMQMAMFMKNVSMLGGALLITQMGAGPWSLDNRHTAE